MRAFLIGYFLVACCSCTPSVNDNTHADVLTMEDDDLKFFSKNAVYYTSSTKEANLLWKQHNYEVFQQKILHDIDSNEFELINVFGNENIVILFNQTYKEGDSTKHLVLDVLYNFDDFGKGMENVGTSLGILDADELEGLPLNSSLNRHAIIAVVQTEDLQSHLKAIDSAAVHRKKESFEALDVKRKSKVLKAWYANAKTKKIESLKE